MTKAELEKEAEEYAEEHAFRVPYDGSNKFYDDVDFKASKEGYLVGAEPREKQITELSKHIVELQKDKGELIDRCRELEAQIEKMKCCPNCDFFNYRFEACYYDKECKNKDHWKLRR